MSELSMLLDTSHAIRQKAASENKLQNLDSKLDDAAFGEVLVMVFDNLEKLKINLQKKNIVPDGEENREAVDNAKTLEPTNDVIIRNLVAEYAELQNVDFLGSPLRKTVFADIANLQKMMRTDFKLQETGILGKYLGKAVSSVKNPQEFVAEHKDSREFESINDVRKLVHKGSDIKKTIREADNLQKIEFVRNNQQAVIASANAQHQTIADVFGSKKFAAAVGRLTKETKVIHQEQQHKDMPHYKLASTITGFGKNVEKKQAEKLMPLPMMKSFESDSKQPLGEDSNNTERYSSGLSRMNIINRQILEQKPFFSFSKENSSDKAVINFIGDTSRTVATNAFPKTPVAQSLSNANSEIAQQIVQKTRIFAEQGKTFMEIQLKPEFLGKVKVQLSYQDGVVSAALTAEKNQTGYILNSTLQQIRNALQEQGIRIEYLAVNVANHGEFQDSSRDRSEAQNHNKTFYLNGEGTGREELLNNEETADGLERYGNSINYLA